VVVSISISMILIGALASKTFTELLAIRYRYLRVVTVTSVVDRTLYRIRELVQVSDTTKKINGILTIPVYGLCLRRNGRAGKNCVSALL